MSAFGGKADMWLKAVLSTLLGVNAKPMSLRGTEVAFSPRGELRRDAALNARIVPRLHWASTAIMTLRAAACRLAISGR
jgi:hypothetical protein